MGVDMDNCDCCFLEAVLSAVEAPLGLRPRFIHVEVDSLVPPPISFRPKAIRSGVSYPLAALGVDTGRQGHMVHCSLAAFVELLEPLGYELVNLFHHDAIFAQVEVAAHLRRLGYLPLRTSPHPFTSQTQ